MKLLRVISVLCLVAANYIGGVAAANELDDTLVLGDSVAFAYIDSAGYEYINPDNFLGFADELKTILPIKVVNAGCPGETTNSFVSPAGIDHGCRAFRARFPLHIAYSNTQLEYAKRYLSRHRDVRLVTITLGANDAFLLMDACVSQPDPAACIQAGGPALFATVEGNMKAILADLRATGFAGAIVITNYYSPDYSDAAETGLTALVNVATAFKTVASSQTFGGKTCNTGLLNASVVNPLLCDVHPSQSGHRLIAQTVTRTYRALNWPAQESYSMDSLAFSK